MLRVDACLFLHALCACSVVDTALSVSLLVHAFIKIGNSRRNRLEVSRQSTRILLLSCAQYQALFGAGICVLHVLLAAVLIIHPI